MSCVADSWRRHRTLRNDQVVRYREGASVDSLFHGAAEGNQIARDDLIQFMSDNVQSPLWQRLPTTRFKLFAARMIYRGLKLLLRNDRRRIRRRGINYEVDLSEGIDLSIFVFGGFQDH